MIDRAELDVIESLAALDSLMPSEAWKSVIGTAAQTYLREHVATELPADETDHNVPNIARHLWRTSELSEKAVSFLKRTCYLNTEEIDNG